MGRGTEKAKVVERAESVSLSAVLPSFIILIVIMIATDAILIITDQY